MTESARPRTRPQTRPQMYSGGIPTPEAYLRSGDEMTEQAVALLVSLRGLSEF